MEEGNSNNLKNQEDVSNLENHETIEDDSSNNLQNQDSPEEDSSDNLENHETIEEDSSDNLENHETIEDDSSNNLHNQDTSEEDSSTDEPKIIQTNPDVKDGQIKCPKCGATDISLNSANGKLRCNFCRHEFEPELIGVDSISDLRNLKGEVIGTGAQNIIADVEDVLTFKCSSCGAEVIIDTSEATQARCHWCRNTLSINQQIPNGAVPDMLLPFKIKKDNAKVEIEKFVGERQFFAHPQFKKEFSTQNVMGVYLPYMVVDINGHSKLVGQGEHEVRRYTVGSGDDKETRYDADLYDVERDFDLLIDDLTIESSIDKLDKKSAKTNNIINSIMPFDTENSVKWNPNYLKGFSSEKRDVNIEQLKEMVNIQAKDIARHKANSTLTRYDRGVKWTTEEFDVKGQKWISAYLPVWLYSYQQDKGNINSLLHYVAVNARTKETMGSVPIHIPKLLGVSAIIEVFGIFIAIFITMFFEDSEYAWAFALAGVLYFLYIYYRYRNTDARHHHESETRATMENVKKSDIFIKKLTGLSNSEMSGANNKKVSNKSTLESLFE